MCGINQFENRSPIKPPNNLSYLDEPDGFAFFSHRHSSTSYFFFSVRFVVQLFRFDIFHFFFYHNFAFANAVEEQQ